MNLATICLAAGLLFPTQAPAAPPSTISPEDAQRLVEQVLKALQSRAQEAAPPAEAPSETPSDQTDPGDPILSPPRTPPPLPRAFEVPPGRATPSPAPAPSGQPRDPFSTSPEMERESQRLGLNAQQNIASLPQLSLRGSCSDKKSAIAWLETPDGEWVLARQGEPLWIGSLEMIVTGIVDGAVEIEVPSLQMTLSVR